MHACSWNAGFVLFDLHDAGNTEVKQHFIHVQYILPNRLVPFEALKHHLLMRIQL